MKSRVEKVFRLLEPKPDALLLANAVDPHLDLAFFYLFEAPAGLFEDSVAIGYPDGSLDVLTGSLEAETAERTAKSDPNVTVHEVDRGPETEALVKKLLGGRVRRVGRNDREITHSLARRYEDLLPDVDWVDASSAIRRARVVKEPAEIARLRKAADIASAVGREIPSLLRTGVQEVEVAAEIEYRMNRLGSNGPSFSTIVAFGPHGAEPHYSPGTTRLKSGDSIVCDYGARYERYASDVTRSFHFGARDDEMKRVHETVEKAQAAALATVRPGIPAKEVHLAAQKVIDASPWRGRLIHGVGHSIGLVVHDGWKYNARSDDRLEEGMAITVEPGIYLTGHGGVRIEDDIVVTKAGYEFLSTAPRSYVEVAA